MIIWEVAKWIGGVTVLAVMAITILIVAFAFVDSIFEAINDK